MAAAEGGDSGGGSGGGRGDQSVSKKSGAGPTLVPHDVVIELPARTTRTKTTPIRTA